MIDGLKKALFASALLNIVLLIFSVYLLINEKPPAPYFELKPAGKQEQAQPLAMNQSNSEMLRYMRQLPMEQLIAKLNDMQLIEDGFKVRDLALASLIAFHHFDLSRALIGLPQPQQQRTVVYGRMKNGQPATVTLFPSLSQEQIQAIEQFAKREKWPLTSQGLFLAVRQKKVNKEEIDPTLINAFYLTPEFLSIEMLFNRSKKEIEKQDLLQLVCEGEWKMLASFAEQQRAVQDLSSARRQRFLLEYVERQSRKAAYLLLQTDADFAAHKLDDLHVMALLRLMPNKTPEAEQFAIAQLTSPRSNAVWKIAARRLYAYAGEKLPESYEHHEAIERFVSNDSNKKSPKSILAGPKKLAKVAVILPLTKPKVKKSSQKENPAKKRVRTYTVQEGDSLWKIARRFKTEISAIKKTNKLQSDFLRPGTTLTIP